MAFGSLMKKCENPHTIDFNSASLFQNLNAEHIQKENIRKQAYDLPFFGNPEAQKEGLQPMIATPDKMETSPIMKSELSDEDQEGSVRPQLIEQKDEPMLDGGSQAECLLA